MNIRLLLRTYHRLFNSLTLGVRAAVIDDQRRVLLIRHTYQPGWWLPGGGVEVGETTLDALKRELFEEAFVELTGAPQLHGVFLNHEVSVRDHVFVYVVRAFQVLEHPQQGYEVAERKFFFPDALPSGVDPGTMRRIDEITRGTAQIATW